MIATTPPTPPAAENGASFKSLPLSDAMLANLDRLGYTTMTLIQAASLLPALAGLRQRIAGLHPVRSVIMVGQRMMQ